MGVLLRQHVACYRMNQRLSDCLQWRTFVSFSLLLPPPYSAAFSYESTNSVGRERLPPVPTAVVVASLKGQGGHYCCYGISQVHITTYC